MGKSQPHCSAKLRTLGLSSGPGIPLKSFASEFADHLQLLWRMGEKGVRQVLEDKEGSRCSWKPALSHLFPRRLLVCEWEQDASSWEARGGWWGLGRLSSGRSESWATFIRSVYPPIPKLSRIRPSQSGSPDYLLIRGLKKGGVKWE